MQGSHPHPQTQWLPHPSTGGPSQLLLHIQPKASSSSSSTEILLVHSSGTNTPPSLCQAGTSQARNQREAPEQPDLLAKGDTVGNNSPSGQFFLHISLGCLACPGMQRCCEWGHCSHLEEMTRYTRTRQGCLEGCDAPSQVRALPWRSPHLRASGRSAVSPGGLSVM